MRTVAMTYLTNVSTHMIAETVEPHRQRLGGFIDVDRVHCFHVIYFSGFLFTP